MKKLERDSLLAEQSSLQKLLDNLSPNDLAGRLSLEERRQEINKTLESLDRTPDTLANVALIFSGEPVSGARSIDAEFAAKILETYQEIITKKIAYAETGGLAQRGPLPGKSASRLNITNVVHGSFGFILEEDDTIGPQLINSSLKEAVESVTEIIKKFTDPDENPYSAAVDEMDARIFNSFRKFFKNLFDYEAVFKIVENRGEEKFDRVSIERGYNRAEHTNIEERDPVFQAVLLGVVPYQRRFEARDIGTGEIIKGKIGPMFSEDYLHRISNDEHLIGKEYKMKIQIKEIQKPNGKTIRINTLLSMD